ncbi:MAG: hypothetical protein AAGB14_00955 [Verrucomicrobiota bacterium]
MKPSTLIALGTAVVGFALGWIIKPSAEPEVSSGTSKEPPARVRPDHSELIAPASRKRAPERVETPDVNDLANAEIPEGGPASLKREEIVSQMAGKRDRARLARLAEALGLEDDQIEAIAALVSKYKGATSAGSEDLLDEAANGGGEFEKALLALLDNDQKGRLEAFKTRTAENRIESGAQQDLALVMSTVDLSTEQRSQALVAFRERIVETNPPAPSSWNLVTGRGYAGIGGGTSAVYRDLFSDPSVANDPAEFAQRLQQEQQRLADEKIEVLQEVLTPAQLAAYRAMLEASYNPRLSIFENTIRDPRFR